MKIRSSMIVAGRMLKAKSVSAMGKVFILTKAIGLFVVVVAVGCGLGRMLGYEMIKTPLLVGVFCVVGYLGHEQKKLDARQNDKRGE